MGMKETSDTTMIDDLTRRAVLVDSLDPDVPSQLMKDGITFTISKTQENCQLARIYKASWDPSQGEVLVSYLHNKVLPGVGKIGSVFVSVLSACLTLLLPPPQLLESGDSSLNDEVN